MPSNRNLALIVVGSFLALLVLGLVGLVVIKNAEDSRYSPPVLGEVPEFSSVRQDGAPFSVNDLKGHLSVVDFIFTTCPSVCPTMSYHMSTLYHQFDNAPQLQFVSISVDPERDSLQVLREYANGFGVDDDRWVFLSMPINDVVWLSEEGFALAAEDLPMGHSTKFVLVDSQARIRGYYDGTDEESLKKLVEDIKQLYKST